MVFCITISRIITIILAKSVKREERFDSGGLNDSNSDKAMG